MRKVILSLAVVATALTAPARAATLNATPKPGFYSSVPITYLGVTHQVVAGPFKALLDGKGPFDAYCVDLDHWNTWNSTYTVTPRSSNLLSHGAGVAWLYNEYAGGVTNATQGAALQMAIWDVLTDNGDGLSAGLFQSSVTGDIASQYSAYLTAWNQQESHTRWLEADSHAGGRNQNLIGPPVPEPGTLSLLGLGVTGLMARARRRRHSHQEHGRR